MEDGTAGGNTSISQGSGAADDARVDNELRNVSGTVSIGQGSGAADDARVDNELQNVSGTIRISQGSGPADAATVVNSSRSNVRGNVTISEGGGSGDTGTVTGGTVSGTITISQTDAAGNPLGDSATISGVTAGGTGTISQGGAPGDVAYLNGDAVNNVSITQGDNVQSPNSSTVASDVAEINGTRVTSDISIIQGTGTSIAINAGNYVAAIGFDYLGYLSGTSASSSVTVGGDTSIYQTYANNMVFLGDPGNGSSLTTNYLDVYTGGGGGAFVQVANTTVFVGPVHGHLYTIDGGGTGNTYYDAGGNTGVSVDPATFHTLPSTTSQSLYIVSQDPDGTDNDLYAVDLNAISGGLFTNYTSIPLTSTMGLSTQIRGLAYDNNNGNMYGITAQGNLVTVNLNTGAENLVYTLPFYAAGSIQNFWSGLAFDGTNNLYVANAYGNHELVDIPVNSPSSAFVVGSITNSSSGSYHPQTLGLAFYPASAPSSPPTFNGTDPAPGVLYGSDRGTDSMNAISTSTASATQLNPGQGTTGVNNLQESVFGPNTGLLYSIHDHSPNSDNSDIAIYNFMTGIETILGQLPFGIVYDGPPGEGEGNYGAGGMGFGPVLATVSGAVYNDLNRSGTLQPGDPGLTGWTVNLENSSGTILATTTSDANGNYQFDNVLPGSYIVADILQSGWDQTQPVNPNYYSFAAQMGLNETGLNFGNFQSPLAINSIAAVSRRPA